MYLLHIWNKYCICDMFFEACKDRKLILSLSMHHLIAATKKIFLFCYASRQPLGRN
jgi:hypothetical protein